MLSKALTLFGILALFITCQGPRYCETVLQAPTDFLDYFYLRNNSVLVYRLQSDTTVRDTVYVFSREWPYLPKESMHATPCEYYYDVSMQHSNKKYFTAHTRAVDLYMGYHVAGTNQWSLQHSSDVENHNTMYTVFIYPPRIGETYYPSDIYLKDTGLHVSTPADSFEHVINIAGTNQQKYDTSYATMCNIYLAPKYGFVRMEYCRIDSTEVWELVDYKFNP